MREEAIRAILRDIAEEAVPVDLTDKVMRGAARRRAVLLGTGAVAVVALALGVTPLALASMNAPQNGAPTGPGTVSTGPSSGPTPGQSFRVPQPSASGRAAPGKGSPVPSQSEPVPGQSQPVPGQGSPVPGQSFQAPQPSTSVVPSPERSEKAP